VASLADLTDAERDVLLALETDHAFVDRTLLSSLIGASPSLATPSERRGVLAEMVAEAKAAA
jgi:hypothetical protein